MGLFSYFTDKKNEEKNAAYVKEGEAEAPRYFRQAQSYLDRNFHPPKNPKYVTLTKEPTPEELARREAAKKAEAARKAEEERKAEEARKAAEKNTSAHPAPSFESTSECRYSISSDSIDFFSDDFTRVYRSPEELAEHDLLETAKRFISETRMPGMDTPFMVRVHQLMKQKNLTPADMYRRAQIDKTTFSKLANDINAVPNKDTAIALALGLELSPSEASDLLRRAGYALSHSSKKDLIIEYCFASKIYNVVSVNCILSELNLKPLGRTLY